MPDFLPSFHALLTPTADGRLLVVLAMLPLFLLGLLAEILWMRRRHGGWDMRQPGQRFYWRELVQSGSLGLAYTLTEALMHTLLVGAAFAAVYQHRLFTVPLTAGWVLLAFLLTELCYYAYHRSAHRIRWFWAQHVTHHDSPVMNMSVAARQSLLNGSLGLWFFFLPPVLLGFHPLLVLLLLGVTLSYQWFIHTEAVPRLHPWLEWWLDTPSNHRVHHGSNRIYADKNFGGVLMIYDHLFGSYQAETETVQFGLHAPLTKRGWWHCNFHEFIALWRDVMTPGPLHLRLKHLWMPPEWQRPAAVDMKNNDTAPCPAPEPNNTALR